VEPTAKASELATKPSSSAASGAGTDRNPGVAVPSDEAYRATPHDETPPSKTVFPVAWDNLDKVE